MTASAIESQKSFTFASKANKIPVVFDLDGVVIRCRPTLDGITLMDFTSTLGEANSLEDDVAAGRMTEEEAAKRGMAAANAFIGLLKTVILKTDWGKFEKTVREQGIPLSGLTDISAWLIEVYGNRPTEQS